MACTDCWSSICRFRSGVIIYRTEFIVGHVLLVFALDGCEKYLCLLCSFLLALLKRRQPFWVFVIECLDLRSLSHRRNIAGRDINPFCFYQPGVHVISERYHTGGFRHDQRLWMRLIPLSHSINTDSFFWQPSCKQRRIQIPSLDSIVSRLESVSFQ